MKFGSTFDPDIMRQIGRIDLIAKIIADGVQHGLHSSRRHGFSNEFSDFKHYSAGDDVRMLDWRLYARTDRLFIKRFEAETSLEVILMLDSTRSMAWQWKSDISKLHYGANLLAALAVLHLRQHDLVGLLTIDNKQLHQIKPRCSRSQLEQIFACLDSVTPAGMNCLSPLTESLAEVRHHKGVVIICTDLEEDPDATKHALRVLGGLEDDVVLFHLLDQHEVNLPFDNVSHLRDSETNTVIAVDFQRFKNEHQESVRQFRDYWRKACHDHNLMYIPLDTSTNLVEVLVNFLHLRSVQAQHRS